MKPTKIFAEEIDEFGSRILVRAEIASDNCRHTPVWFFGQPPREISPYAHLQTDTDHVLDCM